MALTLPSSAPSSARQALAVDTRSLNNLKLEAGQNSPDAAKEAAKQFESLFMRELIKSMRQQLSVQMSGPPGGLSEAIARQLSRQMGVAEPTFSVPSTLSLPQVTGRAGVATKAAVSPINTTTPAPKGRDDFVQHLSSTAEAVAKESGIPASFMLGQAGHETGWGRSEIRNKDGSTSFNLFGIKAGKGWTGKVAEVTTTEYINGVPRKVVAKFRAYDSYEDSFRDYARLITDNPRYEKAQATARTGSAVAYAAELQKAGYATDPEYARKLSGAIQSALRAQKAQA